MASKKAKKKATKTVSQSTGQRGESSPPAPEEGNQGEAFTELMELRAILRDLLEQFRVLGVGRSSDEHNPYAERFSELVPYYFDSTFEELRANRMRRAEELISRHIWNPKRTPGSRDLGRARISLSLNWSELKTVENVLAFVDDRLAQLVDAGLSDGGELLHEEINRKLYELIPLCESGSRRKSARVIANRIRGFRIALAESTIRARLGKLVKALPEVNSVTAGRSAGYWKTFDRLPGFE